jgi:CRP/FNR family transcriptional regulator, cyclic AMP receptor protein
VAKGSKPKFDPEVFLAKAGGGRTISKYAKGQVIFAQGDPADSVFYILGGRIKIAVISAQGKEAVVAFLKAGDFIGEGCLTGRARRISTARALEVSVITRVDKGPPWCGCSATSRISPNGSRHISWPARCA